MNIDHLVHLLPVSLEKLTNLVQSKVPESLVLEYKRQLPGRKDADKKEFLFDVSAFMNAVGGKIIFGVSAKDGVPQSIDPFAVEHRELEVGRLIRIMEDCLRPRGSVDFRWIPFDEEKWLLEANIRPSGDAPIQVNYQGHTWFYLRDAYGKHIMSVDELRSKFRAFNPALKKHQQEYIKLANLFAGRCVILEDIDFEYCILDGPINIIFLNFMHLIGNSLSSTEFIIIQEGKIVQNAVGFSNCRFENCQFINTTWFLPPGTYDLLPECMKTGIPTIATDNQLSEI